MSLSFVATADVAPAVADAANAAAAAARAAAALRRSSNLDALELDHLSVSSGFSNTGTGLNTVIPIFQYRN